MPRRTHIPPPAEQALYQMFVDEVHPRWGKRTIPVGPRMTKDMFGPLMEAISKAVIEGREKQWGMPWLEPVASTHSVDSPFTREDRQNELVGGYRSETVAARDLILN